MPGLGVKQRQEFGRAITQVGRALSRGVCLRLPTLPWIGHGLKRSSLISTPDLHSLLRIQVIGAFDELFFAAAS
jgi:hypothetical protein